MKLKNYFITLLTIGLVESTSMQPMWSQNITDIPTIQNINSTISLNTPFEKTALPFVVENGDINLIEKSFNQWFIPLCKARFPSNKKSCKSNNLAKWVSHYSVVENEGSLIVNAWFDDNKLASLSNRNVEDVPSFYLDICKATRLVTPNERIGPAIVRQKQNCEQSHLLNDDNLSGIDLTLAKLKLILEVTKSSALED